MNKSGIKIDILDEKIELSGMRKSYLATMLGLSHAGFYNKLGGRTEFTASEIKILAELLNLSSEDVIDIFLS